jgi:hypothetical protein
MDHWTKMIGPIFWAVFRALLFKVFVGSKIAQERIAADNAAKHPSAGFYKSRRPLIDGQLEPDPVFINQQDFLGVVSRQRFKITADKSLHISERHLKGPDFAPPVGVQFHEDFD